MDRVNKILIADDDKAFSSALKDYLNSFDYYTVCGVADNGYQALDMTEKYQPDLLILDLVMPNLDGIGVLERISSLNLSKQPQVILITSFAQANLTKKAMELGASYYMMKPFDMDVLEKRIRQLNEISSTPILLLPRGNALEIETTRILHQMGVPAHVKGYQYLRDAIIFATEDPSLMDAVTKELYPMVGDKHNTTASRVERAIRHAIELAWDRGNVDMMNKYFGYTINIERGKPTNSEFIAMIADKIRVGEKMA